MKVLMLYPRCPDTFWNFRYAIRFVSKKASDPPLGLLTVASMLPKEWEKKLVDLNTSKLKEKDLLWADYIFLSAMSIQIESVKSIISLCKKHHKKIVAGGPLFTSRSEEFADIDHLILNEAEITLPQFLNDLQIGQPKHIYKSDAWADLADSPLPMWSLINFKHYVTMNLQYSRGCPFACSFCNITVLFGSKTRTKNKDQLLLELDSLYNSGWRGRVFFVDDNFIGNKQKLKTEILPALIAWMKFRKNPFLFSTEGSINLADDPELMHLLVDAGFYNIFIGIESPNPDSLTECNKYINENRNLIDSIKTIQQSGLSVQGGFIVGFDNDPPTIFKKLSTFIKDSGIITAMVGLLNAPQGTKLYAKMETEGRLNNNMSGDNTDFSMNFIPKMNLDILLKGYKDILKDIYTPKFYYARVKESLKGYVKKNTPRLTWCDVGALFKSIIILGIFGKERIYYWKLFFWSVFFHPRLFPETITYAIYGYHFRKILEFHGIE